MESEMKVERTERPLERRVGPDGVETWPGVLADGSDAPLNTDTARLDWMERNPGVLRNLKGGVYVTNVPKMWQPGVRGAVDAAMEAVRRELRAKGLEPQW